jgi:hypothetical protein
LVVVDKQQNNLLLVAQKHENRGKKKAEWQSSRE